MKWWWTYFGDMDEPEKQAEGAEKAGYVKVYRKDDTDTLLAERDYEIAALKDKCEMHDFFWDGCGFEKRGFKNSIQVSERFDELEAENRRLRGKIPKAWRLSTVARLYRKMYRLFGLKSEQRRDIQERMVSAYRGLVNGLTDEVYRLRYRLKEYELVMSQHNIGNPYELFRALEGTPLKEGMTRTEFVALRSRLEPQYRKEAGDGDVG